MDSFAIARRLFLKRLARYGATAALLTSGHVFARTKVALNGIRISQPSEEHTRIVFDLSSEVKYKLFSLNNPPRVVVDLKWTFENNALFVSSKKDLLSFYLFFFFVNIKKYLKF